MDKGPNTKGAPSDLRKLANLSNALWREAEDECDELRRAVAQRDHVIATIITNLKHGVRGEAVLEWFESEGRALLVEPAARKEAEDPHEALKQHARQAARNAGGVIVGSKGGEGHG